MTSSTEKISPEKSSIVDVSSIAADSLSQRDLEKDSSFILNTPEAEEEIKRAVRKLDLTVIPVMTLFYFLSFLDRANIGNARVAGLQKDLHMSDHQYSIAVTVTYIPYILSELPSNLLLRKVGPNIGMPILLTIWGTIVTLQGLTSSFSGLAVARAFLGLVEGPMFPGIVLYLSGFYTRKELSVRIAFFFSSASLSGAFSGLLAAAISNLNGVGGKHAWSWIFFIEGLFSVAVGIVSFWLVPKTPRHSKFLTDHQKDLIMARLAADRPFTNPLDAFSFKYVARAFKSVHVWLMFIVYFMGGTNLYGLALFLPSIVKQLGHSANRSQLLSVGPFAVGFVFTVFAAWCSDRIRSRSIPLVIILIPAVVGYSMFLGTSDKSVSYAALYLMVPGIYATTPVISAWISNNSEPHYTRATSIALGFVSTNLGGILSTWLYPSVKGPRFHSTTILNLVFSIGMMAVGLVNAAWLHYQNKQKERNRAQILAPYASSVEPDGGVKAWVELGDSHPDFKYIL
ncbi:MFS general substrate transporter [Pholiota conissans]|uniref:MFS general substrate transporter n=1 Tax=Pholiota conissans TaxID=109636 RepID=A0A9P5YZL9_9AGAR|nr:MFS general substrate transporter [Pholiota conissans]